MNTTQVIVVNTENAQYLKVLDTNEQIDIILMPQGMQDEGGEGELMVGPFKGEVDQTDNNGLHQMIPHYHGETYKVKLEFVEPDKEGYIMSAKIVMGIVETGETNTMSIAAFLGLLHHATFTPYTMKENKYVPPVEEPWFDFEEPETDKKVVTIGKIPLVPESIVAILYTSDLSRMGKDSTLSPVNIGYLDTKSKVCIYPERRKFDGQFSDVLFDCFGKYSMIITDKDDNHGSLVEIGNDINKNTGNTFKGVAAISEEDYNKIIKENLKKKFMSTNN